MSLCLLLGLVAIAMGPFDPHPLSDTQKLQVESANDKSPLIEESAFYALLENATDWSDKQAGAVVPDYDAIRRNPEAWRGGRCLIEGTLYKVLRPELMREGWGRVQGVVIRVDHSRATPIADDFVIVYLTEPPPWLWRHEKEGVPRNHGSSVRVVARFFKVQPDQTEKPVEGQPRWKRYLAFVGRSMAETQPAPTHQDPGFWRVAPAAAGVAILAALVLLAFRLRASGSSSGRIQEHIQQRRIMRRGQNPDEDPPDVAAEDESLPPDPSQAMRALADKHNTHNPT